MHSKRAAAMQAQAAQSTADGVAELKAKVDALAAEVARLAALVEKSAKPAPSK